MKATRRRHESCHCPSLLSLLKLCSAFGPLKIVLACVDWCHVEFKDERVIWVVRLPFLSGTETNLREKEVFLNKGRFLN